MPKKYVVRLTVGEREILNGLLAKKRVAAGRRREPARKKRTG